MYLLEQLSHKLFPKQESKSLSKYYTTIQELPVYNWWQITQHKEYKYLLKQSSKSLCKKSAVAFDMLQEDFLKEFGIDEQYKKFIKTKCDIELMYISQVLTNDYSNQLQINILEEELKINFAKEKEVNNFASIMALERFLGRKIEIKKESVYEIYNYFKEMKQWQKAAK